ncbi:DUF4134 family protein [Empedobacter brevis]|uniref:DUF4134 family protein n=1 Tax=Empedobacter brevis TaxID=247 RepID=UPI00333E7E6C
MTKSFIKRNLTAKNLLLVAFLLIVATPAFGQGGASAISNAAGTVKDYWDPVKLILKAVGGIVGLIGGLRVYNKWTNGDQDVNKEILGYGGAMVFLIVVPEFVTAFFN